MQNNNLPQPRKYTFLITAAVILFVILASWFIWLFMGDNAAVRMSMARIMFIFFGLVCTFLFGIFIIVGLKIWRRQHQHN
jgi:multidrug resistance efflux pump